MVVCCVQQKPVQGNEQHQFERRLATHTETDLEFMRHIILNKMCIVHVRAYYWRRQRNENRLFTESVFDEATKLKVINVENFVK